MLKKLVAVAVALIVCFVGVVPSYARDVSDVRVSDSADASYQENEYDYIVRMKEASDHELAAMGYTSQEIVNVRTFSIEHALMERAEMSDEELVGFGYSKEQISLLRAHAKGAKLDEEQIRSVLATFTGSISMNGRNQWDPPMTTQMGATFTWSWSNLPLWFKTDIVTCGYVGINSSNIECSLILANSSGTNVCTVRYVHESTGANYYRAMSAREDATDHQVSYDVPMIFNDGFLDCWAKSGTFIITVKETVTVNQLAATMFNFGYGHTVAVVDSVTIGVSVGFGSSISIGPTIALNFSSGLDSKYDETLLVYSTGSSTYI